MILQNTTLWLQLGLLVVCLGLRKLQGFLTVPLWRWGGGGVVLN